MQLLKYEEKKFESWPIMPQNMSGIFEDLKKHT